MRRPAAWLAVALNLLAACASERWIYSKPGVTPARLDRDLGQCQREAYRPYALALRPGRRLDHEALRQCMTRKGYTARPDE